MKKANTEMINSNKERIISSCGKLYEQYEGNSCQFVKAVVRDLTSKELLSGKVNSVFELIQKSPWFLLGKGAGAQFKAGMAAASGKLVIGASLGNPSGHVSIILDNKLQNSDALSGKVMNAIGNLGWGIKYLPATDAWSSSRYPDIVYAYYNL
jgi:hypothetical protein